jgi:2-dehydro-3-deoxyphosphogluconate aldolase/(4S)-4-hydroxy-2-oxoglutarate aldolase
MSIDSFAELVELLGGTPVLPVLTVDDVDQAEAVACALLGGGIATIEVVFRTPVAAEVIARLSSLPDLTVGAGTLLTVEQVAAAVEAGARFGVAPALDEAVVDACREHGLSFIPGVATASEIQHARTLGMRILKIFPASQLGGPAFVRAVSQVFGDTLFLPTGGVDAVSASAYLALRSVLSCGGSWMVNSELLLEGRFDEIERLAREAASLRR